jgi:hypothetical protein
MMIFSLVVVLVLVLSITISCCVAESLGGGVSSLHSIRSLGPVSGVSERLPLLNPLIHHHVALRLALILIEVLLLLIKCLAGWRSPILLIAVTLMILVLRCYHLGPSLLALLLRAESRIEGLFFIVNGVKRVQDTRVAIALYLNIVIFILNNCQLTFDHKQLRAATTQ